MYESFFGLSGKPFSLLPDAGFLFLSKRHRRAVNLLEYGNLAHSGFVVITGDVGAGKTTIIRHFLKNLSADLTVGVTTNPSKSLGSLMSWITQSLEIEVPGGDEAAMYHVFVEFMLAQYAKGKRVAIVIDEAQNLPVAMLEELRMLSNVNNERDQLLQIILVGQPELLATLNRPELRQFVQRIAVHCNLIPLTASETAAYIRHRLGVVGGASEIFDDTACAAIYFFTYGVPRLINTLCDQALLYSFAEEEMNISLHTIIEVVSDHKGSGLSPFRDVDNSGWTLDAIVSELDTILDEIRKVPVDAL